MRGTRLTPHRRSYAMRLACRATWVTGIWAPHSSTRLPRPAAGWSEVDCEHVHGHAANQPALLAVDRDRRAVRRQLRIAIGIAQGHDADPGRPPGHEVRAVTHRLANANFAYADHRGLQRHHRPQLVGQRMRSAERIGTIEHQPGPGPFAVGTW